ncbi:2-phosphosulfolactate phosphatase [Nocardioides mangrovi]|uniref:Probable 2-phosphosulfolactate phosphatase n=1 Tax=Nocardioides mangrovi TaxID=2874580 RepID=A0ABS7UKP7_9ACTN|nr:2-phosphosulfolactate phosphatase [Nocardioides mangrovi]MBZ5741231.1 2-phosphosulfolactate phosphatase [Nocardioides mangrovi]
MTSVHVEWGPTGAAASIRPGGVAVVVDVLSFTTTLTVAVERGMTVYPFRWADVRATTYARTRDAVLAVGRRAAHPGEVSLSPSTVLAATGVRRLVLPSPNGSSICFGLADAGVQVVGASLRNRSAVARWLRDRPAGHDDESPVVVVAAGERWPDDTLRPAVEDLWGAGAVVAALADLGSVDLSVEARVAEQAFRAVADRLPTELPASTSGRELVDGGFPDDVELAAQLDASDVVPVLADGAFTAA